MANTPNLQFLRGAHANLPKGENIKDGAFYLTTDTNRLYVGQGSDLVELNKSVTIVDKISQETGDTKETTYLPPANNVEEGQFYYVSSINVLCVRSGNAWVQINPDTSLTSIDSAVKTTNKQDGDTFDTKVTITKTFNQGSSAGANDSNNAARSTDFKFETTNLKASIDNNKDSSLIRFDADTYEIDIPEKTNTTEEITVDGQKQTVIKEYNKSADISLQRNNAVTGQAESDTFIISGETGITSILVDDKQNITITPTVNKQFSNAVDAQTGEVTLTVSETEGGSDVATKFTPTFKYGENVTSTVNGEEVTERSSSKHFDTDYTVDLDVYTISEIDRITADLEEEIRDHIRANNAMTFKGTLDTFSGVNSLPQSTTTRIANGDTYMLAISEPVIENDIVYKAGDLFIATGTEATTGEYEGYITGAVTWKYVPAGNDTYSTNYNYKKVGDSWVGDKSFQIVDGQNGSNIIGSVNVVSDDDIVVTPSSEALTSGGVGVTYTIKHGSQDQTNYNNGTTATQAAAGLSNGQSKTSTIQTINGLTTDVNGHITGWNAETVTLVDSHNRIATAKSKQETTQTTADKSVNLKYTIAMTDGDEKSFEIQNSTSATNLTINKNTANSKEFQFNLVWGSFDPPATT